MPPPHQRFHYFPPPPRAINQPITAVIVEKNGDESRTSRKQDELFCFSPSIRIGDGRMIVSKSNWSKFNVGDWVECFPVYAVDKDGRLAGEKELLNLRLLNRNEYARCLVPETRVVNGYVRIKCYFTLCPNFIKNRETANKRYHKLYLMNIGQGLIDTRNPAYQDLCPDTVYHGTFEFRAMDNGAVNFSREQKYVDLERTAMWQLQFVTNQAVSREVNRQMDRCLEQLEKDAIAHSKEVTKIIRQMNQPVRRNEEKKQSQKLPDNVWKGLCETVVNGMYPDENGELVKKWLDKETMEVSENLDLLVFKVCSRRGYPEVPSHTLQTMADQAPSPVPPAPTRSPPPPRPPTPLTNTPRHRSQTPRTPIFNSVARIVSRELERYERGTPPVPAPRRSRSSQNRTLGEILATPLRGMRLPSPIFGSPPNVCRLADIDLDDTGFTVMMRQDNNINPGPRRRVTRQH